MWGGSVNLVRGLSDRSLVFSTFVLGGGGNVAIGRLYILRMVLLSGGYVLYAERVG